MEADEDNPSFNTPTSFRFVPSQLQILQETLADVKKLDNKKDRHRMIKQVRKQVLELPESKALDISQKEDLEAAINSWFSVRSKRQTNKIKFAKIWTARLVLYEENKEEVNEIKAKLYEKAMLKAENPKRPFDYFQRAISKLWKQQSRTDRKRLEKVAKKWNQEGVSREQKQEAATKKTWKYTQTFAEEMYKSLGLRFLFFVAMETPTGSVNTGIMDFNDALGGGASYAAKHTNWKTEGIDLDSWNEHNRDYYNSDRISADISTTKVPRSLMHLDRNEFGEPILPNPLIVPSRQRGRTWRQGVVRAFLSYHYALASGSERAIPWKRLVPVLRDCIRAEYLPSDLLSLLDEPSTMKDDHCHSILSFWYTRQTREMAPTFRFDKYLSKDELVDALPRERVEDEPTDIPPVPSDPKPRAKARGNGRRAKRKAKSSVTPGDDEVNNDESERESITVTKRKKTRKSKNSKKGKAKATETNSETSRKSSTASLTARKNTRKWKNEQGKTTAMSTDSEKSSTSSTSSTDSESSNTTTDASEEKTDSDLVDMGSAHDLERSRGTVYEIGSSRQAPTLFVSTRQLSVAATSETRVAPSNMDGQSLGQPDIDGEDEDMMPSPDLDLAPELQAIAKMLKERLGNPEINARLLEAFGDMTVESQSQSPVKERSRGMSSVTDLGKRRARSSTEGLPPASPTKKSRVRSLEDPVVTSPIPPMANLSGTGDILTEPRLPTTSTSSSPSTSTQRNTDHNDTVPQASSSVMTRSRGGRAPPLPRGNERKGRGTKRPVAFSPRVTRSNSPKKRSTRAHATT